VWKRDQAAAFSLRWFTTRIVVDALNGLAMPTADRRQRELMLIVRRINCRHEVEPKPLNRRAHCAENHRTVARWKG
jgi:hypothetical protein